MFDAVTEMFSSAFDSVSEFLSLPWAQKKEAMRELIAKIIDMIIAGYRYVVQKVRASMSWLKDTVKGIFENMRNKTVVIIAGEAIKELIKDKKAIKYEDFMAGNYVTATVDEDDEVHDIKVFSDMNRDSELYQHVNRTGDGVLVITR